MTDRVQIIKGFQDVVPPRSIKFARIEAAAREVFLTYGFSEVRLPVLEPTELFARGIGTGTDIVEKEMYTFADRKGRSLTLRPEGTAGAVRAYLSAGLGRGEPVKWFYSGPMFRYERPQKGRYRQFYQIGAEAIGYEGPGTDAEIITMLDRFFKKLGVQGVKLELNSLGCKNCRPAYREALVKFLGSKKDALCEDCRRRLETNPLRVLDCKVEGCKAAVADAPAMLEFLDEECKAHFAGVKKDLEIVGVAYSVNPRIVRGLDYYTRTVFEYLAIDGLGAQNAVAAGGRYDGLVQEFGGPPTPAIGFALGVDRAALLAGGEESRPSALSIVVMGDAAREEGVRLLAALRDQGVVAEMLTDGVGRSMKSQMKAADKAGVKQVIIIGDEELKKGQYTIKDLKSGEQSTMKKGDFLKSL
ncbi:MAG TPA: histidine--tRNA ligase [bacterium]|nr:histidine--tRNA ligase [bacterium]